MEKIMTSMHGSNEKHTGYIYHRDTTSNNQSLNNSGFLNEGHCDPLFRTARDIVKGGLNTIKTKVDETLSVMDRIGVMNRPRRGVPILEKRSEQDRHAVFRDPMMTTIQNDLPMTDSTTTIGNHTPSLNTVVVMSDNLRNTVKNMMQQMLRKSNIVIAASHLAGMSNEQHNLIWKAIQELLKLPGNGMSNHIGGDMPLDAIMSDKPQIETMPWVVLSGNNQNKAFIIDSAFSDEPDTAVDMSIDLSDNSQLDSSTEGALPDNNQLGAISLDSSREGVLPPQNNPIGMIQTDDDSADVDMSIDSTPDNPHIEASVVGKVKSKNYIGTTTTAPATIIDGDVGGCNNRQKTLLDTTLSLGYDREKHEWLFNEYLCKSSSNDKKSHNLLEIQTKINIINNYHQKTLENTKFKKSWLDPKEKRIVEDHIVLLAENSNEQVKKNAQYLKIPFPLLMRCTTVKKNELPKRPQFVISSEQKFDIIERESVYLRDANNDKKSDKKSGQRKDPRLNMTTLHSEYLISKLGIWNITLKECCVWYELFKDITNFKPRTHHLKTGVAETTQGGSTVEWTILILQYEKEDTRIDLHGNECDSILLLLNNQNQEHIIAESMEFSTRKICTTLYWWWNQYSPRPAKIWFMASYQQLMGDIYEIMVRMLSIPTDLPIVAMDETRESSLNSIISDVKEIFQDLNYAQFSSILTSEYMLQDGVRLMKKSKMTDDETAASQIDGTISIKHVITNSCYAPIDFVFTHAPKIGTGVYRNDLVYQEVSAIIVCPLCSDTMEGSVRIRSSNVMFRGKEYYDYLYKESVWFETDWMNSFGCLVQHRFHCTRTWFYPFAGSCDRDNKEEPLTPIELGRVAGERVLPAFVDRVVGLIHGNMHYAVLDINKIAKTIDVYDARKHTYNEPANEPAEKKWNKHIITVLRRIGWLIPTTTKIPSDWKVYTRHFYTQKNQFSCGPISCLVIYYLFRNGKVPISFCDMQPTDIKKKALSMFHEMININKNALFSKASTSKMKELTLQKEKHEAQFALYVLPAVNHSPLNEDLNVSLVHLPDSP
jgi:Ulp1 protease family, C-terminal catalytic domain